MLGHINTDSNISRHLHPLLKDADQNIRSAAAIALQRHGKAKSIAHLIPLLKDSEKSVVRVTVDAIGRCGGPKAAGVLIDFYRHGETHDRWGYHIKNEVLLALHHLKANEALPLCYRELSHENATIFRNVVNLIAHVVKMENDRIEAGKRLLALAKENKDPQRLYHLVWGLGRLKYAQAIPFIISVHEARTIPKHLIRDYVVAEALANIGSPQGTDSLMKIYLATTPLRGKSCLDGEPILDADGA